MNDANRAQRLLTRVGTKYSENPQAETEAGLRIRGLKELGSIAVYSAVSLAAAGGIAVEAHHIVTEGQQIHQDKEQTPLLQTQTEQPQQIVEYTIPAQ